MKVLRLQKKKKKCISYVIKKIPFRLHSYTIAPWVIHAHNESFQDFNVLQQLSNLHQQFISAIKSAEITITKKNDGRKTKFGARVGVSPAVASTWPQAHLAHRSQRGPARPGNGDSKTGARHRCYKMNGRDKMFPHPIKRAMRSQRFMDAHCPATARGESQGAGAEGPNSYGP